MALSSNRDQHLRLTSGILLLGPFLLGFLLFWMIPLIWGIDLSVRTNDMWGRGEFSGLENYKYVLTDPLYTKALQNTSLYTLTIIIIIIPLGVLIAHHIRQLPKKFQPLITFCLLLPGLTPPAVLSILFLLFFHGDQGILNSILVKPFGLEPINWIHDPKFILSSLVLQAVWRWTGFIAFFCLCAMDALPQTWSEAARLEGATPLQTLWHVILPQIRHVLLFACVFLLIDATAQFSGAYSLLGGSGGPDNAGLLLITHIYHTAFGKGNFGDAAAISLTLLPPLLFLIVALFARKPRTNIYSS
jgi:ABC-type sugar transport system permease subunit